MDHVQSNQPRFINHMIPVPCSLGTIIQEVFRYIVNDLFAVSRIVFPKFISRDTITCADVLAHSNRLSISAGFGWSLPFI